MKELRKKLREELSQMPFDSLAYAQLDFNKKSFNTFEITPLGKEVYFDLASLTKPLTLSPYFLEKKREDDLYLLLNHRASLPSWARLGHDWKEQVLGYSIKESDTLYSDLSALRLMLEIEKKENKNLKDLCSSFYNKELLFWKDLDQNAVSVFTGFRKGHVISSQVHDDNAYTLNRFCSHAGLFGTIKGICKTLLNMDKTYDLLSKMKKTIADQEPHRFVLGFDTARDDKGLAGKGHSPLTFGHLGFTGTSFWIDPESKKGVVLLTNVTQNYWYNREGLNKLRRNLASIVWSA